MAFIKNNMISTTFQIAGHKTIADLGVVHGVMVRSRSIVGSIGAWIQTLFGGNISLFTDLCERTRQEVFDSMILKAEGLGANAVVGIRYDTSDIGPGVTEIFCYGTAVVVEREQN